MKLERPPIGRTKMKDYYTVVTVPVQAWLGLKVPVQFSCLF